jgi:hypothetical protein
MTILHRQITKFAKFDLENVASRIALRHGGIFSRSRNPFTAV